jgi:hypothetical protein
MSALPPKADMCGATRDVRFGPKADIQSAFLGCQTNTAASAEQFDRITRERDEALEQQIATLRALVCSGCPQGNPPFQLGRTPKLYQLALQANARFASKSGRHQTRSSFPISATRRPGAPLFDHLVRSSKRGRYCEAERLGGLHIDDQKVFRRQLHRKF